MSSMKRIRQSAETVTSPMGIYFFMGSAAASAVNNVGRVPFVMLFTAFHDTLIL